MPEEAMIYAEAEFHAGTETLLESNSPHTSYAVVFEDNGETAYLYGLDNSLEDNRILEAVHIYNVSDVTDRHLESIAQIVWSADGNAALLLINEYPHAAFDFVGKRAYCRTNFPPPDTNWTKYDHEWSDDVLELFN